MPRCICLACAATAAAFTRFTHALRRLAAALRYAFPGEEHRQPAHFAAWRAREHCCGYSICGQTTGEQRGVATASALRGRRHRCAFAWRFERTLTCERVWERVPSCGKNSSCRVFMARCNTICFCKRGRTGCSVCARCLPAHWRGNTPYAPRENGMLRRLLHARCAPAARIILARVLRRCLFWRASSGRQRGRWVYLSYTALLAPRYSRSSSASHPSSLPTHLPSPFVYAFGAVRGGDYASGGKGEETAALRAVAAFSALRAPAVVCGTFLPSACGVVWASVWRLFQHSSSASALTSLWNAALRGGRWQHGSAAARRTAQRKRCKTYQGGAELTMGRRTELLAQHCARTRSATSAGARRRAARRRSCGARQGRRCQTRRRPLSGAGRWRRISRTAFVCCLLQTTCIASTAAATNALSPPAALLLPLYRLLPACRCQLQRYLLLPRNTSSTRQTAEDYNMGDTRRGLRRANAFAKNITGVCSAVRFRRAVLARQAWWAAGRWMGRAPARALPLTLPCPSA